MARGAVQVFMAVKPGTFFKRAACFRVPPFA